MTAFLQSLYESTVIMATPLVLCTLGGLITYHAGIVNVAMEGMLLASAFAAVTFSFVSGSAAVGIIGSILAGTLVSLLYAFFVITLRTNNFAMGIAINIFVSSLTLFLTRILFVGQDAFNSPKIAAIPKLNISTGVRLLDILFFGYSYLVYSSVALVFLIHFIVNKTPFGLRLRAAGSNVSALASAGGKPALVQYKASILAGIICGLAGAQLSISNVVMFSRDMSAGRGFICLAAILISRGRPKSASMVAVLFGFFSALSIQLQALRIPTHFLQMIPYAMAIIALVLMDRKTGKNPDLDRFE